MIDNTDNIYLYIPGSVGSSISPYTLYEGDKPFNLVALGGSSYNSALFYARFEANGLEELTEETFSYDNVYLIGTSSYDKEESEACESGDTVYKLYTYLSRYGAVDYQIVDEIMEGVYVYKFYYE